MKLEKQPYMPYKPSGGLLPKEEMLEVAKRSKSLTIGLPGDDAQLENRISLVPNAVGLLVQNGHRVLIERESGQHAWFSDHEYAEYGGEIVDKPEVFKADIVMKVASLCKDEIEQLNTKATVFTSLQFTSQHEEYFRMLMQKKITALAFEYIQDKTGAYPVRRAMSEMAGTASVMTAAEYLSHPESGKGHMLGGFSGISPSEVVILGAGTVGEYAARAALGMGAMVKIFDNSIYKLKSLQNHLSQPIFTSVIQPNVLLKALKTADVVIAALFTSSGLTPIYVSEEMVSQMKPGS
ncbi:MAG: NAD-binding protein, partial [Bacteroidales bacterium]|nr:NAD-binding protein [Bacteroidales bacterium]